MPVQPSAPRHFSLAARSGATYPKDSPSGESPPLGRTRSASRHPFPLYPPFLPLPAPFVGGAKRRRVSKRFAVRRISPLWLGRIVKEGAGPLLDTPAPLPRPAFPATLIPPRGRVSGGGLPSRLPIVPGGFAGGRGAISAFLPEPPVPPCSHPTPQPFLQPWHGGNRFLSGRGRVRGASRVRARGPRGPALPRADGASRLRAEGKRAPPGNGQRPFPGQRSAPIPSPAPALP